MVKLLTTASLPRLKGSKGLLFQDFLVWPGLWTTTSKKIVTNATGCWLPWCGHAAGQPSVIQVLTTLVWPCSRTAISDSGVDYPGVTMQQNSHQWFRCWLPWCDHAAGQPSVIQVLTTLVWPCNRTAISDSGVDYPGVTMQQDSHQWFRCEYPGMAMQQDSHQWFRCWLPWCDHATGQPSVIQVLTTLVWPCSSRAISDSGVDYPGMAMQQQGHQWCLSSKVWGWHYLSHLPIQHCLTCDRGMANKVTHTARTAIW